MDLTRRKAIEEYLRQEISNDNQDSRHRLLHSLSFSFPDHNICHLGVASEEKLQSFLDEADSYSLLPSRDVLAIDHKKEHEFSSMSKWYILVWKGKEYEIVVTPFSTQNRFYCCLLSMSDIKEVSQKISKVFSEPTKTLQVYQDQMFEDSPEMLESIKNFSWEDLILPESQKEDILFTVSSFFDNKDVYDSLNVAWRRGILFTGVGGTGKTLACKAIINMFDLPTLYIKTLSGYDSTEFALNEVFTKARRIAPCIVVLEDLDSLIDSSNRSVFLNELDGFYSNDGILLIATSNHPEDIDEAMLKRPSRFDRVFRVEEPSATGRKEYVERFISKSVISDRFNKLYSLDDFSDKVAEKTTGFTPAYLKEVFIGVALQYASDGKKEIDEDYEEKIIDQIKKLQKDIKSSNQDLKMIGKAGAGFNS